MDDALPTQDVAQPLGLSIPRRLTRLGRLLAWLSATLACGGTLLWLVLDGGPLGSGPERGPWPMVLGVGFVLGLMGMGCGIVALAFGGATRRGALGAVTVSLIAPTLVAIVSLALFFASTTLDWN